jgi:hypothetical protein
MLAHMLSKEGNCVGAMKGPWNVGKPKFAGTRRKTDTTYFKIQLT